MNIYYINIEESKERKKYMEEQFKNYPFTLKRIKAVTPSCDLNKYIDKVTILKHNKKY